MKLAAIAFVVVSCLLGVVAGVVAIAADASRPAGYEPVLQASDFSLKITNPYFPLPVGRTWVYRGIKDGQTQIDRVTVTARTKRVAEGITARGRRDRPREAAGKDVGLLRPGHARQRLVCG